MQLLIFHAQEIIEAAQKEEDRINISDIVWSLLVSVAISREQRLTVARVEATPNPINLPDELSLKVLVSSELILIKQVRAAYIYNVSLAQKSYNREY